MDSKQAASQLQRISLTDVGEDEYFRGEVVAAAAETLRFDASYAVRVISDLVPTRSSRGASLQP